MYHLRLYQPSDRSLWNAFLAKAKNATFLFHRDFMEYHSDRFTDHSLLIFQGEQLVGLLPATTKDEILYSHQGLTYGGIIVEQKCKLEAFLAIFDTVVSYAKAKFRSVYFKTLPAIYAQLPSDELLYALFLHNAKLVRRDTLSVIDYRNPLQISSKRHYEIQKGIKSGIQVAQKQDFTEFWNEVLIPNLKEKHGTLPVHSLDEITLLKSRFPKNIAQYNAYYKGQIVAGATLFITESVVHVQYISSNSLRSTTGALDYLFSYLIDFYKDKALYFDFGISNENQGRDLNNGLLFWKESFGARTITQDFYSLDL